MSNIWSNVGADIAPRGDEWLYRRGEEIRGPVTKDVIVKRIKDGELDLKVLVAREGGDFHPIAQVKAFEPHLDEIKKAIRKRNAGKVRNVILAGLALLVVAGAGSSGWRCRTSHRGGVPLRCVHGRSACGPDSDFGTN